MWAFVHHIEKRATNSIAQHEFDAMHQSIRRIAHGKFPKYKNYVAERELWSFVICTMHNGRTRTYAVDYALPMTFVGDGGIVMHVLSMSMGGRCHWASTGPSAVCNHRPQWALDHWKQSSFFNCCALIVRLLSTSLELELWYYKCNAKYASSFSLCSRRNIKQFFHIIVFAIKMANAAKRKDCESLYAIFILRSSAQHSQYETPCIECNCGIKLEDRFIVLLNKSEQNVSRQQNRRSKYKKKYTKEADS